MFIRKGKLLTAGLFGGLFATADSSLIIKTKPVPVRLMSGKEAVRIGIDFTKKTNKGAILMRFQPLD